MGGESRGWWKVHVKVYKYMSVKTSLWIEQKSDTYLCSFNDFLKAPSSLLSLCILMTHLCMFWNCKRISGYLILYASRHRRLTPSLLLIFFCIYSWEILSVDTISIAPFSSADICSDFILSDTFSITLPQLAKEIYNNIYQIYVKSMKYSLEILQGYNIYLYITLWKR